MHTASEMTISGNNNNKLPKCYVKLYQIDEHSLLDTMTKVSVELLCIFKFQYKIS